MSFLTWLLGGISGLTGLSSMAAFLVHLFSGNADMALQYFMVLGLSVALAWIVTYCRQARVLKALPPRRLTPATVPPRGAPHPADPHPGVSPGTVSPRLLPKVHL